MFIPVMSKWNQVDMMIYQLWQFPKSRIMAIEARVISHTIKQPGMVDLFTYF